MYVSKELALILKEKRFNEECNATISLDNQVSYWYDNNITANDITTELNGNTFTYFEQQCVILLPTEHQIIDWIFKDVKVNKHFLPTTIEWLQFWYNILVEYKFSLMYEFIGRLEEWFENNNIEIEIQCSFYINSNDEELGYKYSFIIIDKKDNYSKLKQVAKEFDYTDKDVLNNTYVTKQQAKYKAILKCFELLKIKHD